MLIMPTPIGFAAAAGGGAAFAVEPTDAVDIGQVGAGGSGGSGTASSVPIGAADASRDVLVFCYYNTFDTGTFTVTTIGGNAATLLTTYNYGTAAAGGYQIRVYEATVASGTTADIAYSTDAECFGIILGVARAVNWSIIDHETIDTLTDTASVTIDSESTGVLLGFSYGDNGAAASSYTNMTSFEFVDSANVNDLDFAEDQSPPTQTAGTETATYAASASRIFSVFSFDEAP